MKARLLIATSVATFLFLLSAHSWADSETPTDGSGISPGVDATPRTESQPSVPTVGQPGPQGPRGLRGQAGPPVPQGHERIQQDIKSWNPASASFVEARDEKLLATTVDNDRLVLSQARAEDARLQAQVNALRKEKADASLLWLVVGLTVVCVGGLLVYLATI